jgi:hypothetical protein
MTRFAWLLEAAFLTVPAFAQDKPAPEKPAEKIDAPLVSVTRHSGTFGGVSVAYIATARETYLKA